MGYEFDDLQCLSSGNRCLYGPRWKQFPHKLGNCRVSSSSEVAEHSHFRSPSNPAPKIRQSTTLANMEKLPAAMTNGRFDDEEGVIPEPRPQKVTPQRHAREAPLCLRSPYCGHMIVNESICLAGDRSASDYNSGSSNCYKILFRSFVLSHSKLLNEPRYFLVLLYLRLLRVYLDFPLKLEVEVAG